jgi:heptosyltransferase-2
LKKSLKILVIGPSWVGDMVMAQSLFITLKNAHPECQIDVLAPAWSLALMERMPEVTQAIAMPLAHGQFNFFARVVLGKALRANAYDQTILLPNSWKSGLIPYFANIPLRTGYIGECRWGLLNDARKLDKSILTMTVQRFVALGLPSSASLPPEYPIPRLVISHDQQASVIEKFHLSEDRDLNKPSLQKILALCPGAEYGEAKRWPINHYAEVARQKLAEGWKVWLFGSEKDKVTAEQINTQVSGACVDFTGRTSLAEAVDLMSLVDTVVSNDSGLMHVAAALDKNIIALYGSSDPGFTPPLNNKAKVISLKLTCSPCFKRVCPLGHTDCLTGITPDAVLKLIQE